MKRPSVATASYDPIEEKEEHVAQKQGNFIPEEVVCPKEEALTMDAYRSTYFAPLRIREKTSFTMNAETLEILRNVLQTFTSVCQWSLTLTIYSERISRNIGTYSIKPQPNKDAKPPYHYDNDPTIRHAPCTLHPLDGIGHSLYLRSMEGRERTRAERKPTLRSSCWQRERTRRTLPSGQE